MVEGIASGARKARKRHICWHCGKPIEPGETYKFVVSKDGGIAYELKMHQECDAAADAYFDEIYHDYSDGDGMPPLPEMMDGDFEWLKGKYQTVYDRITSEAKPIKRPERK